MKLPNDSHSEAQSCQDCRQQWLEDTPRCPLPLFGWACAAGQVTGCRLFRPLLLTRSTAIRKDQKYFPCLCVSPQIARLICPSWWTGAGASVNAAFSSRSSSLVTWLKPLASAALVLWWASFSTGKSSSCSYSHCHRARLHTLAAVALQLMCAKGLTPACTQEPSSTEGSYSFCIVAREAKNWQLLSFLLLAMTLPQNLTWKLIPTPRT